MMCAWLVAVCCPLIVLSSPAWVLLNHNLPTTLHPSVEECSSRGDSDRLARPTEVPSRRRRALLPASDLCTSRNFYLRNRKVRKNIRSSDVNRGGRDCEISAEGGHAQSLSFPLFPNKIITSSVLHSFRIGRPIAISAPQITC